MSAFSETHPLFATDEATRVAAERTLPWLQTRVGVVYRWTEPTETQILNPLPLATTFYPVQGLDEPSGIGLRDGSTLFVRTPRRATARGATLSFVVRRRQRFTISSAANARTSSATYVGCVAIAAVRHGNTG